MCRMPWALSKLQQPFKFSPHLARMLLFKRSSRSTALVGGQQGRFSVILGFLCQQWCLDSSANCPSRCCSYSVGRKLPGIREWFRKTAGLGGKLSCLVRFKPSSDHQCIRPRNVTTVHGDCVAYPPVASANWCSIIKRTILWNMRNLVKYSEIREIFAW